MHHVKCKIDFHYEREILQFLYFASSKIAKSGNWQILRFLCYVTCKAQYVTLKIEKFFTSNLTSFRFDMMHNRKFDQWQVLYFMWKFWYLTSKIKKLYVFDLMHNKESSIFSKIWRFLIFDFHNEDIFIFDMRHTFKNLILDNF